jgi:pimeloyl-ACP methyl ester carboxylesterase
MYLRTFVNSIFYLCLLILTLSCKTYNEKDLAKQYYHDYKFISIDNFEIFVIEKNLELSTKITPIIFIHGFSSNVHTWEYYLQELGKSYPIVAFDIPGFGFSSKPEISYTREGFVEILDKLVNYYKFNYVILIGNSMGGEISLRYSLKYPNKVKKLVLIDSAGLIPRKELPVFLQKGVVFFAENFNFVFRNRFAISYMLKSAFYNKDVVDERKVDLYYYPLKTAGGINAHKSLLRSTYNQITKEEMNALQIPTLIIWGQNDTWISLKYGYEFKNSLPNSQLIILPECGHVPQEEKPEESLFYIKEFIKDI